MIPHWVAGLVVFWCHERALGITMENIRISRELSGETGMTAIGGVNAPLHGESTVAQPARDRQARISAIPPTGNGAPPSLPMPVSRQSGHTFDQGVRNAGIETRAASARRRIAVRFLAVPIEATECRVRTRRLP